MNYPIAEALRILAHFWLAEIRPADLAMIAALPELAETLPKTDETTLTGLAVEYQRLFGFNLPPYESIFIDPAVMLLAPATARVQALYRQAGWDPPAGVRIGAPDHLGVELLALADWLEDRQANVEAGLAALAHQLQTGHLALWVPAFILTLRRLAPHPFYAALGDLTLDLLLATLSLSSPLIFHPSPASTPSPDPFPSLPPPPIYEDQGLSAPSAEGAVETDSLRGIAQRLLRPCETGLFLTREDIAQISRTLNLPGVVGERLGMLETLFRQAGQYDLLPALLDQLGQLLAEADMIYQLWAEEYLPWTRYAQAWRRRLASTQAVLDELKAAAINESGPRN